MKKREIEGILERLREIAGTHVDREMCEKVGIKYGTLDNWKIRDSIPSKRLRQIALDNSVNPAWLEFGEGEMLKTDTSMPDMVNEASVAYGSRGGKELVNIPYHASVYASAGGGSDATSMVESSPVTFSRGFLNSFLGIYNVNGLSIINAAGDSMAPTIKSGELMFVYPMENEGFKDGSIYVVMCGDALLVKRVWINPITKEYTLKSDSVEVEPIVMKLDEASGCHFVGRVVGHLDRV